MKNNYLSSSFNSVVSLDMDSSWAAKSWDLSNIYWNQNGNQAFYKKPLTNEFLIGDKDPPIATKLNRGKVRQLFLERRGKGWDRSNPLEPIKLKSKSNRVQGQSILTKSLSNLPDYYSNPVDKLDLAGIPVKLPNLGTNTMQSHGNDLNDPKKIDHRLKSKIPQPKIANKSNIIPPTDEMRKLTLSPRKVQVPDGNFSPAKIKPATPGLSSNYLNKVKSIPEKSISSQKGGVERVSESSKSNTPRQTPSPRTPIKTLDPDMAACSICGRSFLKDRLAVHEGICKKSKTKKRKVFDPVKHRLAGTEAEPYLRKSTSQPKSTKAAAPKPKSDWRKKHEEFISTIRAAKQVQEHLAKGGNIKDLPPPPPMDTSDYTKCPHCGRKFNKSVADRHIPICSRTKSNKSSSSKRIVKKK